MHPVAAFRSCTTMMSPDGSSHPLKQGFTAKLREGELEITSEMWAAIPLAIARKDETEIASASRPIAVEEPAETETDQGNWTVADLVRTAA